MNDLSEVMQLIDKHANKLPEGDYLGICNLLKKLYSRRAEPDFFFDYDTFDVPQNGQTRELYEHFFNFYINKALNADIDYIGGNIEYLRKELTHITPLKNKTKKVRNHAFRHYCLSLDLIPEDYTPSDLGLNTQDISRMADNYMLIENRFRDKYRKEIERRLDNLEDAEDKLYEI